MRNVIEIDDRRFFYFYNENHQETAIPDSELEGMGLDAKLTRKAFIAYKYYFKHVSQMTSANKV